MEMTDAEIVASLLRTANMCKEHELVGTITIEDDVFLLTYAKPEEK